MAMTTRENHENLEANTKRSYSSSSDARQNQPCKKKGLQIREPLESFPNQSIYFVRPTTLPPSSQASQKGSENFAVYSEDTSEVSSNGKRKVEQENRPKTHKADSGVWSNTSSFVPNSLDFNKSMLTTASEELRSVPEASVFVASSVSLLGRRSPDDDASSPMSLDGNFEFPSAHPSSYHTANSEWDERKKASDKVFCSPEYEQDIFKYLKERELAMKPSMYIWKQTEVGVRHRCILVDWLVDVAEEYGLDPTTLHLAVRYTDLFLSVMDVPKRKLQLVGTTAMMIASKIEEIFPPYTKEFVSVTDDTYTLPQVKKMETLMLVVLNFNLTLPTAYCFARRFLKICNPDEKKQIIRSSVDYMLDLTLFTYEFLSFEPSKIAGAAVCLSNLVWEEPFSWPLELENCSGYNVFDLSTAMDTIVTALHKAPISEQRAIYDRYSAPKFHQVATIIRVPESLEIVWSAGSSVSIVLPN